MNIQFCNMTSFSFCGVNFDFSVTCQKGNLTVQFLSMMLKKGPRRSGPQTPKMIDNLAREFPGSPELGGQYAVSRTQRLQVLGQQPEDWYPRLQPCSVVRRSYFLVLKFFGQSMNWPGDPQILWIVFYLSQH